MHRPLKMRGCAFAACVRRFSSGVVLAQILTIFTVTMRLDSVLSITFVLLRTNGWIGIL
jgi:hypothetical protein